MTRWLIAARWRLARSWRPERTAADDTIVFRVFARNLARVLAAPIDGADGADGQRGQHRGRRDPACV